MFIQKITIKFEILSLRNNIICFEDEFQNEILAELNADKMAIIYKTFTINSDNMLVLHWDQHDINDRIFVEKHVVCLGKKYKGEIQLDVKEILIDDQVGSYVYIDGEYIATY